MDEDGRSWIIMKTGRISVFCDHLSECMTRKSLETSRIISYTSSMPHGYKGTYVPWLEDQCKLSCLLQQLAFTPTQKAVNGLSD